MWGWVLWYLIISSKSPLRKFVFHPILQMKVEFLNDTFTSTYLCLLAFYADLIVSYFAMKSTKLYLIHPENLDFFILLCRGKGLNFYFTVLDILGRGKYEFLSFLTSFLSPRIPSFLNRACVTLSLVLFQNTDSRAVGPVLMAVFGNHPQ